MAAVIDEARRRRRRRRVAAAFAIAIACAATGIALAVVTSGGSGRSVARQQVGQIWMRADGHLVDVTPNGDVLKDCVPRSVATGTRSSGQIWVTATNGSRTIRLAVTPRHCRA